MTRTDQITLLDILKDASPEHSLLLSYAAPPLVVETLLLSRLQRRGQGNVTILVDPQSYRDALLESGSAQWAGVHYGYSPVFLPRHTAAFHPKVFVLLGPEESTLLVSSANLTPSSLHENAEVVDCLRVNAQGEGDVAAFLDVMGMLFDMTDLDDGALQEEARDSIRQMARLLEPLLEIATTSDGFSREGPRLLHTFRRALLPQIAAAVPAGAVREIVAVSPFFDGGSAALHQLAGRYPDAGIRVVIRPGEPTDLTADHLSRLGDRVSLEAFADEAGLRLHAKTLLLRGEREQWLVTGSANLTAPAWLRSVPEGGNAEVVVLRHSTDLGDFADFGRGIPSRPMAHDELVPRIEITGDAGSGARTLRILSAEESNHRLTLRVADVEPGRFTTITLRIEAPGLVETIPPSFRQVGSSVEIVGELSSALLGIDGALIAHVEVTDASGERREGSVWIHRPSLRTHSARERRWRRMVARLDQLGWNDDPEDYSTLIEFWWATVESVQVRLTSSPAADTERGLSTGKRTSPPPSDANEEHDDRRRLIERASESLFRALTGEDQTGLREEEARSGGSSGSSGGMRGTSPRRRTKEDRENDRLDRWLLSLAPGLFFLPHSVEGVDEVLLRMDLMLRVLLRRYAARVAKEYEDAGFVMVSLRKVLAEAFSLAGAERGRPQGWLARAWADEALQESLWDGMASAERRAVLLTCFALAAGEIPKEPQEPFRPALRGDLAGLELACGAAAPWKEDDTRDHIARIADGIGEIAGLPLGLEAVRERLERLRREPIPLTTMIAQFDSLLRAERGDLSALGNEPLEKHYIRLRRRSGRVALTTMTVADPPACSACFQAVPLSHVQHVTVGAEESICVHCGVILLPFDPSDVQLTRLIAALKDLEP